MLRWWSVVPGSRHRCSKKTSGHQQFFKGLCLLKSLNSTRDGETKTIYIYMYSMRKNLCPFFVYIMQYQYFFKEPNIINNGYSEVFWVQLPWIEVGWCLFARHTFASSTPWYLVLNSLVVLPLSSRLGDPSWWCVIGEFLLRWIWKRSRVTV